MNSSDITPENLENWLPEVCYIAYLAGQHISTLYHHSVRLDVEDKKDGSPVTEADKQADEMITTALQDLVPTIPLITEESVADVPFETRQAWSVYWLVDPLDGTKEFISRTGEYSVNIALIVDNQPVLGVVYGPEVGDLYFSIKGQKAYKLSNVTAGLSQNQWLAFWKKAEPIHVNHLEKKHSVMQQERAEKVGDQTGHRIKVAVSRRHGGMLKRFSAQLGEVSLVKMGSALKTCLVAEGKVDIYPRFGPTSLWDTAASHCILESAGGALLNAAGHPLQYVQTESLLNPFFIAVCDENYPWPHFPEVF
ncbi:MAG: 3'(2'),5'-bisphosphate nucleotidase CysQ family protein [Pseudomonadota bacterium]